MIEVNGEGPAPTQIMLVGEAPGSEEERLGRPFVGPSGHELDRLLSEVGLSRSAVFVTNVCRLRPVNNDISVHVARTRKCPASDMTAFRNGWATQRIHDGFAKLKREIEIVKPNLIVAFGNVALWALSGKWGIGDWRGSELRADVLPEANPKLIPTYHPAAILRQWSWRAALLADLRRAALNAGDRQYPQIEYNFGVRPSFRQATDWLSELVSKLDDGPELRISFDLETRNQHIACAGFATDAGSAFCIPFMVMGSADGLWAESEEVLLVRLIQRVLTHPHSRIVGQNLLYDAQYTFRWWHCVPRVAQDTMISFHTAFCELPKALDFQASLMCDRYSFWKNDGKVWDPHIGEETLWRYNCEDAARTYEVAEKNLATIAKLGLDEPHRFQQAMFWPVLQAMQRGIRIDTAARDEIAMELIEEIGKREAFLNAVLGHPINVRSIKQMFALFYGDLQMRPIMSRTTGRPTINDDALSKIAKVEPILRPVVAAIQDIRTLGVFLNTFVKAPLDADGRMRCSYNVCGTLTFRLSSSENAFGSGTNLQNLPSDKSKSVGKSAQRGSGSDGFTIPNLRRLFIPDTGFTFFDMDLDRADLQVVVWEAEDEELKHMLRAGADIHTENAKLLFGPNATKHQREFAKVFIHGTNYGGSPRTMALHTGVSVAEAARMQQRWFEAHPGIRRWQVRVDTQLRSKRFIENRFGYRWYVFDRVEGLLGEALAWGPQSTVAVLINKIWHKLYTEAPEIQVLLQVHDNLSGQFPTHQAAQCIEKLKTLSRIPIPYNDPLVIPVTVRTSERSWGECY